MQHYANHLETRRIWVFCSQSVLNYEAKKNDLAATYFKIHCPAMHSQSFHQSLILFTPKGALPSPSSSSMPSNEPIEPIMDEID